jgi:hypothetical protein
MPVIALDLHSHDKDPSAPRTVNISSVVASTVSVTGSTTISSTLDYKPGSS